MSVIDQRTINRNDKEDGQEQNSNVQQLSTSAPLTSRSTPFTTGTAPQQGSGRFTNLQKYINANQGAGEQIATRINNQTNRDYDTFNTNLADKNQAIQSGIDMGNNLINTQGKQYKDQLGAWNQGLNSFNTVDNRGSFDQTGAEITAFTKAPQVADFQKLQSGQAIDQQALQNSQNDAKATSDAMLKQINDKNNNIQTEQGRYDLLRQAQPKFGNYNLGQGKLDQLMFQTNPQAISNLQSNFGNQLADVQAKNTALGAQGASLGTLANDETSLINALNSQAQANQNTFNTRVGSAENFKSINDARSNLYDDYIGQLQSGNLSGDLSNLLGVSNLNTYNLMGNTPSLSAPVTGGMFGDGGALSQKISSPYQGNQLAGNFSTYNTLKDPTNASKYLTQSKMQAKTLQDAMLQPDYDIYKALAGISGVDTMAANGVSNLDAAAQRSTVNDLSTDIGLQNKAFVDNYANRNYLGQGIGQEFYSGAPQSVNQQSSEAVRQTTGPFADINAYNTRITNGSNVGNAGYLSTASAVGNVDDYVRNGAGSINSATNGIMNRGNDNDMAKAYGRASAAAVNPLQSYLQNIVDTTGVKNRATIDPTMSKYKRFKGLV